MVDKKNPISHFDLLCLNMKLLTVPDHDHEMIRSKKDPPMLVSDIQYRLFSILIYMIYFQKDSLNSIYSGRGNNLNGFQFRDQLVVTTSIGEPHSGGLVLAGMILFPLRISIVRFLASHFVILLIPAEVRARGSVGADTSDASKVA